MFIRVSKNRKMKIIGKIMAFIVLTTVVLIALYATYFIIEGYMAT